MDSLIRESIRFNPIGETGLERIVGKKGGFTFSDGTQVPQGALLAAPIKAYQRDENAYPGGFNPRRSMEDTEHPKVTDISPAFLNFGLGRAACPGRWFTSNLLKLVLTRLLLDYDFVRLPERPKNVRKVTLDEPVCPKNVQVPCPSRFSTSKTNLLEVWTFSHYFEEKTSQAGRLNLRFKNHE